jgi:cytochrome P450
VEIDLLDPSLFAGGQPYAEFTWLREHDPVHWQPEPDGGPGIWVLTRHADIKAVETDSETFSSEPTTVITDRKPIGDATHRHLIFSDPPHHTAHRRFLTPEQRGDRAVAARGRRGAGRRRARRGGGAG